MKIFVFFLLTLTFLTHANIQDWYENPTDDTGESLVRSCAESGHSINSSAQKALQNFFQREEEMILPQGLEKKDFALFLAAQQEAPKIHELKNKDEIFGILEAVQKITKSAFTKLITQATGSAELEKFHPLLNLLEVDYYYLYNFGFNTKYSVFVRTNVAAGRYEQQPMNLFQTAALYHQLWLGEDFDHDQYQKAHKLHQDQGEGARVFEQDGKLDIALDGRYFYNHKHALPEDIQPSDLKKMYDGYVQHLNQAHAHLNGLRLQLSMNSKSLHLRQAAQNLIDVIDAYEPPHAKKFSLKEDFKRIATNKYTSCIECVRGTIMQSYNAILRGEAWKKIDTENYAYLLADFYSDAYEIKMTLESEPTLYHLFHGTNSGILPNIKSSKSLIPTGLLMKFGIVPLTGELASGSTKEGVNNSKLSGTNELGLYTASDYAERTSSFVDESFFNQELKERIRDYNNGDTNPFRELEDFSESGILTFVDSTPDGVSPMEQYFVNLKRKLHGFEHRIRQLKKSGQWVDQPEFSKILNNYLSIVSAYEKSERFKNRVLPREEGGQYQDYYYYIPFKTLKGILEGCISAIQEEITPLSPEEKETLKPENIFPIVVASPLPGHMTYNLKGEISYNAFLSFKEDIDAFFVPEKWMPYMAQWLVDHGITEDGKGPKVLDFKNLEKDYQRKERA
jgi:hypothetical protein